MRRMEVWGGLTALLVACALTSVLAQEYEFKTLAGAAGEGHADGKGRKAQFAGPQGIAVDKSGRIYVADRGNHVIRLIMPDGTVSTYAGKPKEDGFADGPATEAMFGSPAGVALDSSTNVYVADVRNQVIRRIAPDGTVSTFAGIPGEGGYVDGPGDVARFRSPVDVAVDGSNNVFVADFLNHVIRKITPDRIVSTVLGKAGKEGRVDGLQAEVLLNRPLRVAVGISNILYFAQGEYDGVRMLSPSGLVSPLVEGTNFVGYGKGRGREGECGRPGDLTVDSHGNVLVAESSNSAIRRISPSGTVKTIAGKFISMHDREVMFTRSSRDGIGMDVRFSYPRGIAVDKDDNIYVADTGENSIRIGRPVRK